MLLGEHNLNKPCRKNVVLAILVPEKDAGIHFIGTNWCETPVAENECPRVKQNYAPGEGYHLCKEVCHQTGHAEENVLKEAGPEVAKGSTVYILGHTYVCGSCQKQMTEAGVKEWFIVKGANQ